MSRGTGADARAFVAWLLRGWPLRLALAGLAVLAVLGGSALAAGKDYATCFSEGKVDADQQIAACTPIAEDVTEASRLRVTAYFYRGLTRDGKKDWDGAIADYSQAITLDPTRASAYFNRGADWFEK